MYNYTIIYIFNRLVKLGILFFILYLIFTNFGTFLMILGGFILVVAFLIYNFKQKLKTNGFSFRFDSSNFQNSQNFNFNDFNHSNFQDFRNQPRVDEISKAKEFVGFTQTPTKEELKKRYKELAKKYHPDINDGNDENMKQLNHYRDVLQKIAQ